MIGGFYQTRKTVQNTATQLEASQAFAEVGSWQLNIATDRAVWSPTAYLILERDPTDVAGSGEALMLLDEDSAIRECHSRLVKYGEPFDVIEQISTAKGNRIWIRSRGQMVPDSQVDMGVFTNITERMEKEADLESARRQAEAAVEARTQFLANMSHEMRTPLNGIIGAASLFNDADASARDHSLIQVIRTCGEYLLLLVEDILDFAKLETGHFTIQPHPFALSALVENCTLAVARSAGEKGLELRTTVSDDNVHLVGDARRLQQIIVHLLANAVKFTASGQISMEVEIVYISVERVDLQVRVVDTGIGIEEEMMSKLFDPFEQADVSNTRQYSGAGIGLAVAYQLSEPMSGTLSVTSEPGKGSTFTLAVPCDLTRALSSADSDAADTPMQKEQPAQVNTADEVSDQGLKILLVEDNPINQKVAAKMLSTLGHNVNVAENGQVAVDAFSQQDYDAVFMDVQMPVMDGVDATIAIRALPSDHHQPVIIALSANVLPEEQARCIDAGMDAFLGKPARLQQLESALAGIDRL